MNKPSVKTLCKEFSIPTNIAEQVRDLMDLPSLKLRKITRLINEHNTEGFLLFDTEYLAPNGESMDDSLIYGDSGITYANAGDMYVSTIMYDHKFCRYRVGSIADVIERSGRRFN